MIQILIRFLVGGAVVSVFAPIGDVLKPKSFAGLFGATPFGADLEDCNRNFVLPVMNQRGATGQKSK